MKPSLLHKIESTVLQLLSLSAVRVLSYCPEVAQSRATAKPYSPGLLAQALMVLPSSGASKSAVQPGGVTTNADGRIVPGEIVGSSRPGSIQPREPSKVGLACLAALSALENHTRLVNEPDADDPSVANAGRQLETTLADLRQKSLESLADVQDKCRVVRQLELHLPRYDRRLQAFAIDLALEIGEFISGAEMR